MLSFKRKYFATLTTYFKIAIHMWETVKSKYVQIHLEKHFSHAKLLKAPVFRSELLMQANFITPLPLPHEAIWILIRKAAASFLIQWISKRTWRGKKSASICLWEKIRHTFKCKKYSSFIFTHSKIFSLRAKVTTRTLKKFSSFYLQRSTGQQVMAIIVVVNLVGTKSESESFRIDMEIKFFQAIVPTIC